MSQSEEEEHKKQMRMNIIYKALEDGWAVKKSENDSKTFEFTKNKSLKDDYKGLVIFSKSNISTNGLNICDDIQKHLENIINTSPEACEFVFSDDASTDDSVAYVKNLQKKYSKLKIISHKTNQGFAQNSNNAVKKCFKYFLKFS